MLMRWMLVIVLLSGTVVAGEEPAPAPLTMATVMAAASEADWCDLDPETTLVMQMGSHRIVIELAPEFAPNHVANIVTLVREGYFDGLVMIRSQDNYVAQWGDAADGEDARDLGSAAAKVMAELDRESEGLAFTRLGNADVYAPEVGFSHGFPAGRDLITGRAWLAHCYGAVGVSRGAEADSGNGSSLYAVTGHAPRHLDRNITLVGRVVAGMEHLTMLPRGSGGLGFYVEGEKMAGIDWIRVAADLEPENRPALQVLRTDTDTFAALIEARRIRREEWFLHPVGQLELCTMPIPTRPAPTPSPVLSP
jgi:peptidylprolyl isomerase